MDDEKLNEKIQLILVKLSEIESKICNMVEKYQEHSKNIDELYNERSRVSTEIIRLQMQIKIVSFVGSAVALGIIGGLVGAFLKIILK